MVVKLASLRADLDKEAKGTWEQALDLIPDEDVSFLVSSIHLPAYTIARDLLFQRLARTYKKKPVPERVLIAELGKLFADHLLHGWKGFDVEYTPEAALELLTDPANRLLVKAIESCAGKAGEVEMEFVEEAAKN